METSAGKHGIEAPSDGTIADMGKGQTGDRRKMFKRIGTDMDRIVSSYGLGCFSPDARFQASLPFRRIPSPQLHSLHETAFHVLCKIALQM